MKSTRSAWVRCCSSPLNPQFFHLVVGLPQSGRVQEADRQTLDDQIFGNDIPGRAGNISDQGPVGLQQLV